MSLLTQSARLRVKRSPTQGLIFNKDLLLFSFEANMVVSGTVVSQKDKEELAIVQQFTWQQPDMCH